VDARGRHMSLCSALVSVAEYDFVLVGDIEE